MFKHSLVALAAVFTFASCGAIDNAVDCQTICDRYKSCFENAYDSGACATRCRDKSKADTDFKRKADVCNACIGDRSCTSSVFSCGTECAGIVP